MGDCKIVYKGRNENVQRSADFCFGAAGFGLGNGLSALCGHFQNIAGVFRQRLACRSQLNALVIPNHQLGIQFVF